MVRTSPTLVGVSLGSALILGGFFAYLGIRATVQAEGVEPTALVPDTAVLQRAFPPSGDSAVTRYLKLLDVPKPGDTVQVEPTERGKTDLGSIGQ